jgi:hypothetical protein
MSRYEDILYLPHPVPRQKMSPWQRGAQFSPFAALTGFEDVVAEEGRLTEQPLELAEDAKQALNAALAQLKEREHEHPQAVIAWFCPDSRKEGGSYITTLGRLKKLDKDKQQMILTTGEVIPLSQIYFAQLHIPAGEQAGE